jgi:hypothetical protein
MFSFEMESTKSKLGSSVCFLLPALLPSCLSCTSFSGSPYADDPSFEVVLRATTAMYPGEVLQEADDLPLAGDFLLVRAGYVGNLDLRQAVKNFGEKRRKDSGLVMDCLVRPKLPQYAHVCRYRSPSDC